MSNGKSLRIRVASALLCALTFGFGSSASAATISFAGAAHDAGINAVKTFGTLGYDLYATAPDGAPATGGNTAFGPNRLSVLPTFINSVTSAGANNYFRSGVVSSNPAATYADVINPLTNSSVHLGLTYNQSASNAEKGLLNITVGAGAPSTFYIASISNQGPASYDQADSLRLRQTAGVGAGDSGMIATTTDLSAAVDLFFFKVSGAQAGDVLTLSGIEGQLDNSGVAYDLTSAGLVFSAVAPPAAPVPLPSAAWGELLAIVMFSARFAFRLKHRTA